MIKTLPAAFARLAWLARAGPCLSADCPLSGELHERHDAADFETKTQDKLEAA